MGLLSKTLLHEIPTPCQPHSNCSFRKQPDENRFNYPVVSKIEFGKNPPVHHIKLMGIGLRLVLRKYRGRVTNDLTEANEGRFQLDWNIGEDNTAWELWETKDEQIRFPSEQTQTWNSDLNCQNYFTSVMNQKAQVLPTDRQARERLLWRTEVFNIETFKLCFEY